MAVAVWRNQKANGPRPWPLQLYDQCRRYNALPRAGGILDQDGYETRMMDHATTIEFIASFKSRTKAAKALTESQLAIYDRLIELN